MKFSEKLKKLRQDNNLTQDELAEKIFVTRTAISKWETDKGYPSIDSLKTISNLFKVSIDELISDEDIKNKQIFEKKVSRKMYYLAISFLALAIIFACFVQMNKYFCIPTFLCMMGYLISTFIFKRKNDFVLNRASKIRYIIRIIVYFIVIILVFALTCVEILK